MKGLLILLAVLAALLSLTNGCGLTARRNTAAGLLQIGKVLAGNSLGGGGAGGSVVAGLGEALAGNTGGSLVGGIGRLHVGGLTRSSSSVISGSGSSIAGSGLGAGLGALAAGLGGSSGGSLITQVGELALRGLSSGGSSGGIPGSGGNAGLLVRQGVQQAGHTFAGRLVMATSTRASSSTRFGGSTQEIARNVGVLGSQPGGLPGGGTLPGGELPASNVPGQGGVPLPLGTGAEPATTLLGGGIGVPSAGGYPGGGTRLGGVSASSISASAINAEQTLGQPLQQTGNPLGAGPLGVGGAATVSTVTSAAHVARHTVGNLIGVAANPNSPGSSGGAPNGGTRMLPTGAGQGGTTQGPGPVQGVQPSGQLFDRGSIVVGSSSHLSATSTTTNMQGNGVENGLNVAQGVGQQVPQIRRPFGEVPIPSGGAAIQSGAEIAESAIQNSLDVAARLNGGGSGGSAFTPGGTTQGPGPVQGVPPSGQLSGRGSFVVGSSSHHSATTMTTNIQGSRFGNGMNVAQGVGQQVPQIRRPFGEVPIPSGVATIQSGTHIAESAIRNSLDVAARLNGVRSGGRAFTPGRLPGPDSTIPVIDSGSGLPGGSTQGLGPRQGAHPSGQLLGRGSIIVGSSSRHSTTSATTNMQGNGVENGGDLGQAFGQGTQTINQLPGRGSIVAVTTTRQSSSRWGAHVVQSSGGSLGNGLPSLPSVGPGGMPSTGPSVLGSTGTSSGLLTAIVGAATAGGRHGGPGAVPGGSLGVLGSSGTSVSGSSSVISGIEQGQLAHKPHGRKPSPAAAAGIALGVVAGTLALGAIGSGIAGAINSGMAGGGRRGGGCPRRACGGGCGRKRRSILPSKVPAEVLNNIPMDFNLRY